jgi:hypothetical protein
MQPGDVLHVAAGCYLERVSLPPDVPGQYPYRARRIYCEPGAVLGDATNASEPFLSIRSSYWHVIGLEIDGAASPNAQAMVY